MSTNNVLASGTRNNTRSEEAADSWLEALLQSAVAARGQANCPRASLVWPQCGASTLRGTSLVMIVLKWWLDTSRLPTFELLTSRWRGVTWVVGSSVKHCRYRTQAHDRTLYSGIVCESKLWTNSARRSWSTGLISSLCYCLRRHSAQAIAILHHPRLRFGLCTGLMHIQFNWGGALDSLVKGRA